MDDNKRILHLLEDLIDSHSTPEAVCVDAPDLLPEVRQQWALFQQIDAKINALCASDDDDRTLRASIDKELPHLPGYEMRSILGRGGAGVVYSARHLRLDRLVAVKMLLGGQFASVTQHRTLLREAQAVARLRHPNIVHLYDIGDFDGRPYFTMELVEGKTLAQEIGGVPLPAVKAARLMLALANAVQFAHSAGIIHRDLKPSNVLLTADGIPKITDFGLARSASNDHSLTLEHRGTPSYMAPENCTGDGSAAPALDVYALGAILYDMLTGRPPFRGESAIQTQRQLLTQEPVPPSRLNKPVPGDLETICLKCLQKDPRRRYGSAAELAEDLRRYSAGEPIAARRTGSAERTAKWIWRHPAVSTAIVCAMVILLACVAIATWFASQAAARNRAVTDELSGAVVFQQQSNWQAADAALDRASVRLGDHGPHDLLQRLAQIRGDSQLAARLDAIAARSIYSTEGLQNFQQSDQKYGQVFAAAGIPLDALSAESASGKISNSPIRNRLIVALYEWFFITREESRPRLWKVICQTDHDPTGWRERIRADAVWQSPAALARAAEDPLAARQTVPFCMALCHQMDHFKLNTLPFLARVQDAHPQDFWANLCLADALMLNKSPTSLEDSVRYFQAAIAIIPDSTIARFNFATCLGDLGRHAEKIEQLRHSLQSDPECNSSRLVLAIELFSQNGSAEAIELLRQYVRQEPHKLEVICLLGFHLDRTGDIEGSRQQFAEALRQSPENLDMQAWLRNELFKLGRNDEAFSVWQKSIQLKPADHAVWNGYAEFCLFNGHENEYRRVRTELLKRFGNSDDPHVCERVGRACLLLPPSSNQELQQACKLINRAVDGDKTKPSGFLSYYMVSKALADLRAGDPSAAVTDLEGDPMHRLGPAPGLILAMAEFKLDQTDDAIRSLSKAIVGCNWDDRSDPQDYWIYQILRREAERMILAPT